RSTVMRWECGETLPQPWARPKLARALGISDQSLSELLGDSADPVDERDDQVEEDVTKRRQAIGFAGKAMALALRPDFRETIRWPRDGGHRGPIDKTLVSAHQGISQEMAGLYRSADPSSVLGIIVAYADELLGLLDEPMSDKDYLALTTIVV